MLNLDASDGLTNGAYGHVHLDDVFKSHQIIWVCFADPVVGQKRRSAYASMFRAQVNRNWTPLVKVTKVFQVTSQAYSAVLRRQFPIQFAAGRTVHRMQGLSLDKGVISLPEKWRCAHLHYVALSRYLSLIHI